ncbi:ferric reductase-like transmembrane domain-containing protein [Thalassospira sp.]|uniref:ferredoxin reductase family protein n=1 Tax=Thalassospira sp. TaxID=1912094 RepID=UPI0027371090|nr:ferric reductase-like transmembrane domain-containing protein [Thalassospira sp.]MDP2698798.1 ferric reductase-like transmembrane domain-containing protein [Thalassospira sp.]
MRKITQLFWGFLGGLTILWLFATPEILNISNFFELRHAMVQYSGVIAIGSMSLIMLLSTRPRWMENFVGGLDKSYRLHKWLGITALSVSILHWLWSNGPKWATGLGLIQLKRPARPAQDEFGVIQSFLASQRGLAEGLGEWAFYGATALMVLALIKWFPYHWFAKTHTILAGLYLVLAAHALVLFDFADWLQPLGVMIGVMLVIGSLSALIVLSGRVGKSSRAGGIVEKVHYFPEIKSLEITIRPDGAWKGHQAGQFAFISFDSKEPPHPFTLASAWTRDVPRLTVIAKELGDYTRKLPGLLKQGHKVILEGPYGAFSFNDSKQRQIWIAGGIGMTPFMARLEQLAQNPTQQTIDFYQTGSSHDPSMIGKLRDLAVKAGVNLHVLCDDTDGFLTGMRLRTENQDWLSAGIWFCGPDGFAKMIRQDLVNKGLSPDDFHQELFSFR